ncbi:cytotoxic translational repressor of toxin-antitoxin stability system [Pseudomonas tohonis]|uniref:Cytotoxic translational repressor of toxin-antitoxin stability system n=1 Tax=Pseudomonas tohonis TaxID=2725477 RepID=A0A6J4E5H7_9PSED|nr:type II toxin-antitoxin system RelE/ParE family toxin [Pseudomonas tohonis]UXY55602.1 type II toxin-antitoxin system RelE/ParE family toxin [Pseudomonas tohonis]BCG24668.1 cytotoxic translational repressor of toxin-antitoxin stability system [Pseudomonas tohonis]GJN51973.1 cytotoxic translational repressor of toxin-antitoxin stability system [Pseudomonas tohonis]
MNEIRWTRKAIKQLRRTASIDQKRIYDAVQALAAMPDVRNVKALVHHQFGYRLRVGLYRVIFDWDGSIQIVSIEEVKKRDEHTY